jgi:DNA repair protein RadC
MHLTTWRLTMGILDWPRDERPREKLLRRGVAALSDAELLAIVLRNGRRGKTAVDLARELLSRFGGLRGLFRAGRHQVCALPGLGMAKYIQLQATIELGRRTQSEALEPGRTLSSPADTRHFLQACLRDRPHEVFCCLYLDTRHRVIAFEELFRGSLDGAVVHPREVVKQALAHNAAALIFAHNHPSGVAEPSQADERLTRRLQEALGLVEIRVLDHLVIGDGVVVSFCERGLI